MKKRKKTVRHRADDDETYEDNMANDEPETKEAEPLLPPGGVDIARDVGASGTAALRVNVGPNVAVDTYIAVGALPPNAAVIGGGVWVSEAFDGGGTLELGVDADGDTAADPNTFASVSLGAVGFTPVNLKEPAAPRPRQTRIVGKIDGGGENTTGAAAVVLLYA